MKKYCDVYGDEFTATDLLAEAKSNLNQLTDSADGTQMHRRAVVGKKLTTGEKAIECMYGGFEVVEPASVADTLFQYAQKANFHDLQFGTILTLDEARAFMGGDRSVWNQYQTPEAKRAVRKLLTDYDLLEAE